MYKYKCIFFLHIDYGEDFFKNCFEERFGLKKSVSDLEW